MEIDEGFFMIILGVIGILFIGFLSFVSSNYEDYKGDFCESKGFENSHDSYIPDGLKKITSNVKKIQCVNYDNSGLNGDKHIINSRIYDVDFVNEKEEIITRDKWTNEISLIEYKNVSKFIEVRGDEK